MKDLIKIASLLVAGVFILVASGSSFAQHPQRNPRMGKKKPPAAAMKPEKRGGFAQQNPRTGQRQNKLGANRGGQNDGANPNRAGGNGQALNPNQNPKTGPNHQLGAIQQMRQRIARDIGVTPEQDQRFRMINQTHDDEIVATGRRVRQANQALDRAMMSEQYNESEVEKRIDEFADARREQARLNARLRFEVRKVLTPEQIRKFNEIQRERRRQQQQQRLLEMEQQQQGSQDQQPPGQAENLDLINLLVSSPPDEGSAGASPK
ncbi:MAG TPA: periplasmic heavy metal sensor [Blastocatellia bacterium]|nr:periplasmic heavy metal sensor [Blastocatellia bacterium]